MGKKSRRPNRRNRHDRELIRIRPNHPHRAGVGGWNFTPVMVDARLERGAPLRCIALMPDDFVDHVADLAGTPAPPALYMANANPSPRNELDEDRAFTCMDCVIERWPHTAAAFTEAAAGRIMLWDIDGVDGWTSCEWHDFEPYGPRPL